MNASGGKASQAQSGTMNTQSMDVSGSGSVSQTQDGIRNSQSMNVGSAINK
jgi:hypothetical protein